MNSQFAAMPGFIQSADSVSTAIEASALVKTYGEARALDGLSFFRARRDNLCSLGTEWSREDNDCQNPESADPPGLGHSSDCQASTCSVSRSASARQSAVYLKSMALTRRTPAGKT
jgi:hypothetical protein